MQTIETSPAVQELVGLIGHEVPLDVLHGAVRRSAQVVKDVAEYGTALITCSDEFQGELRRNFDRDVARALLPHVPNRTFAVSNMAGRVEPAALKLADQHFTVRTRKEGAKLLLVQIAAHVGRHPSPDGVVYGELNRFGVPSPCCGALATLLDPPASAAAVRHPWFDQLSAFFGSARLAALRADSGPHRLVSAAIVHAVLQAETSLADLLRDPPTTPTHVLLVPLVIVNQRGSDGALLVGCHHLIADGTSVHIESGMSLRSTPGAHRFAQGQPLVVESPWEADLPEQRLVPRAATSEPQLEPEVPLPTAVADPHVQAHIARAHAQMERLGQHPHAWRVYSRPVLRGLLQGLSVIAPEVGLVALMAEGAGELARRRNVRRVLAAGPSSEEARRVLHDLEPEIQQLGHREAREVLESLLATYGGKRA